LRVPDQTLDEILVSLTELEAAWEDTTSSRVIERLRHMERKAAYSSDDLHALLNENVEDAKLIFRLFLGLSKDEFETALREHLPGGTGAKAYVQAPDRYIEVLISLGALAAMAELVNTPLTWTDLLVERLRAGRGRAIRGQVRGRSLEDFVERMVQGCFNTFDSRCSFIGRDGRLEAKADFAIPSKHSPRIIVEAKGYAATGSKQTDVIGDLRAIANAKRHDTVLVFFTDGLTWRQRQSDLKKVVAMQNEGLVTRIYTRAMSGQFIADLKVWKAEFELT
jgi:hypothetical protein